MHYFRKYTPLDSQQKLKESPGKEELYHTNSINNAILIKRHDGSLPITQLRQTKDCNFLKNITNSTLEPTPDFYYTDKNEIYHNDFMNESCTSGDTQASMLLGNSNHLSDSFLNDAEQNENAKLFSDIPSTEFMFNNSDVDNNQHLNDPYDNGGGSGHAIPNMCFKNTLSSHVSQIETDDDQSLSSLSCFDLKRRGRSPSHNSNNQHSGVFFSSLCIDFAGACMLCGLVLPDNNNNNKADFDIHESAVYCSRPACRRGMHIACILACCCYSFPHNNFPQSPHVSSSCFTPKKTFAGILQRKAGSCGVSMMASAAGSSTTTDNHTACRPTRHIYRTDTELCGLCHLFIHELTKADTTLLSDCSYHVTNKKQQRCFSKSSAINSTPEILWHLRPNTSKISEPLRTIATHMLKSLRVHIPTPKGIVVQADSYIWRVAAEAVRKRCKQPGLDGCSFRFSAAGFFEARLAAIARFNQILNNDGVGSIFQFPKPDPLVWNTICATELRHIAEIQRRYGFPQTLLGGTNSIKTAIDIKPHQIPYSISSRAYEDRLHINYPPSAITYVEESCALHHARRYRNQQDRFFLSITNIPSVLHDSTLLQQKESLCNNFAPMSHITIPSDSNTKLKTTTCLLPITTDDCPTTQLLSSTQDELLSRSSSTIPLTPSDSTITSLPPPPLSSNTFCYNNNNNNNRCQLYSLDSNDIKPIAELYYQNNHQTSLNPFSSSYNNTIDIQKHNNNHNNIISENTLTSSPTTTTTISLKPLLNNSKSINTETHTLHSSPTLSPFSYQQYHQETSQQTSFCSVENNNIKHLTEYKLKHMNDNHYTTVQQLPTRYYSYYNTNLHCEYNNPPHHYNQLLNNTIEPSIKQIYNETATEINNHHHFITPSSLSSSSPNTMAESTILDKNLLERRHHSTEFQYNSNSMRSIKTPISLLYLPEKTLPIHNNNNNEVIAFSMDHCKAAQYKAIEEEIKHEVHSDDNHHHQQKRHFTYNNNIDLPQKIIPTNERLQRNDIHSSLYGSNHYHDQKDSFLNRHTTSNLLQNNNHNDNHFYEKEKHEKNGEEEEEEELDTFDVLLLYKQHDTTVNNTHHSQYNSTSSLLLPTLPSSSEKNYDNHTVIHNNSCILRHSVDGGHNKQYNDSNNKALGLRDVKNQCRVENKPFELSSIIASAPPPSIVSSMFMNSGSNVTTQNIISRRPLPLTPFSLWNGSPLEKDKHYYTETIEQPDEFSVLPSSNNDEIEFNSCIIDHKKNDSIALDYLSSSDDNASLHHYDHDAHSLVSKRFSRTFLTTKENDNEEQPLQQCIDLQSLSTYCGEPQSYSSLSSSDRLLNKTVSKSDRAKRQLRDQRGRFLSKKNTSGTKKRRRSIIKKKKRCRQRCEAGLQRHQFIIATTKQFHNSSGYDEKQTQL